MTPEERAKRVMFGNNAPFMDDDILTASHGYIISYPQLVAAIREAVKAEREACCELCVEKMREAREYSEEERRLLGSNHDPNSYGAGYDAGELDAYEAVAAAIRERPL